MDIKIKNEDIKFKYRVSAIIETTNKVLIEKYNTDKYCLPGGYVSLGETSEEALIREIQEELDFTVDNCKYIGTIENFFINRKQERTHEIDMYYIIKLDNSDIDKINLEKCEQDHNSIIYHHLEWIDKNNLKNYNLVPNKLKEIILNNEEIFHYVVKY